METTARFLTSADNSRPFKSHRYDIFGLKIDHSLTLFGRAPLNAWILLEADPTVIAYCGRPLIVPDTKPKRLVDFWVRFRDREELWLLPRHSQPDANTEHHDAMPAFATWAASNKMAVRFVKPIDPVERKTYLDNWGRIIRELSANRRFVSPAMVDATRGAAERWYDSELLQRGQHGGTLHRTAIVGVPHHLLWRDVFQHTNIQHRLACQVAAFRFIDRPASGIRCC